MIKDREVSLGLTYYSYSLETKQSFLVKMSAFVFIPYGYYGIRVPDTFIQDAKFAQVYTG